MKKRWYQKVAYGALPIAMLPALLVPQAVFAKTGNKIVKGYFVVSRMEGDVVLLENESGVEQQISRSKIPKKAKEGDVLSYYKGKYRRDIKRTKERKKRIEAYLEQFWRQ